MRAALTAAAVFVPIGLAAGGLFAFKWQKLHPEPGPAWEMAEAVEVVSARRADWRPMADLVGSVFALRSVRLQNELAGRVTTLDFASGAVVESGQVLVMLDDRTERADLEAARATVRVGQANLAAADARVALALTEVRRMEAVARAAAMSEIELDRARTAVEQARAERARAAAEIDLALARVAQVEARLAKLVVRAPFRGRVGIRSVHDGQFLAEGTTIATLEEVSERVYLDFAIPQDHAHRVRPGLTVDATSAILGPGTTTITVEAMDASVDFDTRNVRVRAVVEDRAGALRPGMFVPIRVPVDEPRPYVMVPRTAVRRTSWADMVFAIVPDEKGALRARQRFVKLGPTVGDDVIVLEGVGPGDELAAGGSFKLRDGSAVQRGAAAPAPVGGSP